MPTFTFSILDMVLLGLAERLVGPGYRHPHIHRDGNDWRVGGYHYVVADSRHLFAGGHASGHGHAIAGFNRRVESDWHCRNSSLREEQWPRRYQPGDWPLGSGTPECDSIRCGSPFSLDTAASGF